MYFGRVTTPPRQPPRPPPRPPTPPPRPPGARPPGPAKAAPSKAAASAKAAFAKAAGSPLFRRARYMLFRPRQEWSTISGEFTNAGTIYKSYVIPLSAVGPIATVLGALVFGKVGTMFGPVNASLGAALEGAVAHYVLGLASVYALAIALDVLAPSFGAQSNRVQALKLAAYARQQRRGGGEPQSREDGERREVETNRQLSPVTRRAPRREQRVLQQVHPVGHRIQIGEGPKRRREIPHRVERAAQEQHRKDREVHHAGEGLDRADRRGEDEPHRPCGEDRQHDGTERERCAARREAEPRRRQQDQGDRQRLHGAEQRRAQGFAHRDGAARDGRHEQQSQHTRIPVRP